MLIPNRIFIKLTSMILTFLIAFNIVACSANNTLGTESSVTSTPTTPTTTSSSSETNTSDTVIVYDFLWDYSIDVEFEDYCIEKSGYTIEDWIQSYGLEDNPVLENLYVSFVNDKYDTNYEYIPFSESAYFNRVINADGEAIDHQTRNDEDWFYHCFLFDADISFQTQNPIFNKYFMSYLVWSETPFGKLISFSEYVEINPNFNNEEFQALINNYYYNPNNNIDWSTQDNLSFSFFLYNRNLFYICRNEAIYDMDIAADDELCAIFNEYLIDYFGDCAPQFGEPFTREMYIELFGEEPYEFEYLY